MVLRFSAGLTTNCAPSRMHMRAVSASSTVPAPIRMSGRSSASRRITRIAPGTVIVTSNTVTPPAAIAAASARAWVSLSARSTGTRPISRNDFRTSVFCIASPVPILFPVPCSLFLSPALPLHPRAAALHNPLHFVEASHGRIAWGGHRQRTVRAAAVDRPIRALLVQKAVDQPRRERVAAADAIEDLQVRHRPSLVERAFVIAHRTPVVDGRRLRMAQGRGYSLEVRKRRHRLLNHLAEVGPIQFTHILAHTLNLEAERGREVLLIADHHVDIRRQLAIHLRGAGLPANRFPYRVAVVQVVADNRPVLARRNHRL